MPKVEKLSTRRSAVLARERREKEKEENKYNTTLKEYVTVKYAHIIDEFNPFYESLKENHPANMVYTNTNEFRLWRKREIEKTLSTDNVKVIYFDKQDLAAANNKTAAAASGSEQQSDNGASGSEQQSDDGASGSEQQNNDGANGSEQQNNDGASGSEQQNNDGASGSEQQSDEQPEQQDEQQGELAHLVNEIVGELEDEGIALDLYEELQADIELFDYRLEVELEEYA